MDSPLITNKGSPPLSTIIEGHRVILRPVRPEDLSALQAWDEDQEIVSLIGKKFMPETPIGEWYRQAKSDSRRRILAIETADGRLIGDVELEQINWRSGTAEMRICIGRKAYWGKGYGTDTIRTLLEMAFERLRLAMIYLRVYESNTRAISCYERCGFVRQGVLKPGNRFLEQKNIILMTVSRERFKRRFRTAVNA